MPCLEKNAFLKLCSLLIFFLFTLLCYFLAIVLDLPEALPPFSHSSFGSENLADSVGVLAD